MNCVYCDLAKGLFNKKNISYEEKNYTELTALSGQYPIGVKFPQIYIKKSFNSLEYIGGYTELYKYLLPEFNYDKLKNISKQLTRNLNNIIDYNFYPTPETRNSNLKHRPIGIGVQGLANVFLEFGYSFDSQEAKDLNEKIFECIYYGSMESSMELSKEREKIIKCLKTGINQNGYDEFICADKLFNMKNKANPIKEEIDRDEYLGSYSSFIGSPLYNGKFQFDLWNKKPSGNYDWSLLMEEIQKYGVRNSLLLAPMPTASTAQILGNYECFEPIMSNVYSRRVLAGEYMVMNEYLVEDLISLNLWSKELKDKIIANDGSVLNIKEIPEIIRNRYKTVWEIKQRNIIDMAADRGKYICQSQSMNLFLESPTPSMLTSMHFYGWQKGLKTGIYYLRSRPSSKAIQFTLSPESECENCSG